MSVHGDTTEPQGGRAGYLELRERAVRVLAERQDGLDAADLAAALFGATAGGRWALLLPSILGADTRFVRVGGRWRLAQAAIRAPVDASTLEPPAMAARLEPAAGAAPASGPALADERAPIVTLALATTGADPRRHRIVRVAMVRREGGEVAARLDLAVDAGQRLARYLRTAAGFSADDAADTATRFPEVVPDLLALADDGPIHVYGAAGARAFLDAESRRAELPPFDAHFVEIDALLREILPTARKPGLLAAAAELGLPALDAASPLAQADLAARVVERLRERHAVSPPRPAAAPAGPGGTHRPRATGRRPEPFTRAWLATVPNGPGVYCFLDDDGRTLYVGKSAELRRRLAAYVGRQPSLHRRLEGLGVRAADVELLSAPSDLEATLLEARLIRERHPPFNVARQTRPTAAFVRAAPDEPSPCVRLVAEIAADGARYFGPFESASAARRAVAIARAAFPAAFARRRGDVSAQRLAVLDVCRLLAGQKEPTLTALREAMRAAAACGDAAEVRRLRQALRDVQALSLQPSFLAGLRPGWRALVLERLFEGWSRLHLLDDGWLAGSVDTDMSALPAEPERLWVVADQLFASRGVKRPPDWEPYQTALVLRWLAQTRGRVEIGLLPRAVTADEHGAVQ